MKTCMRFIYIRIYAVYQSSPLCILVPALKLVFQVDDTLVPPSRRDRRLLSYSIPSRSRLVTINRSFRRSLMEREGDGAIPSEFALVYRGACISDPSSFVRSGAAISCHHYSRSRRVRCGGLLTTRALSNRI